jgi:hypothetical protein
MKRSLFDDRKKDDNSFEFYLFFCVSFEVNGKQSTTSNITNGAKIETNGVDNKESDYDHIAASLKHPNANDDSVDVSNLISQFRMATSSS